MQFLCGPQLSIAAEKQRVCAELCGVADCYLDAAAVLPLQVHKVIALEQLVCELGEADA